MASGAARGVPLGRLVEAAVGAARHGVLQLGLQLGRLGQRQRAHCAVAIVACGARLGRCGRGFAQVERCGRVRLFGKCLFGKWGTKHGRGRNNLRPPRPISSSLTASPRPRSVSDVAFIQFCTCCSRPDADHPERVRERVAAHCGRHYRACQRVQAAPAAP